MLSNNRFIEIKMTKCTIFLTEVEFISLLAHDRDLWEKGLRRGKSFIRARNQKEKERKNGENE